MARGVKGTGPFSKYKSGTTAKTKPKVKAKRAAPVKHKYLVVYLGDDNNFDTHVRELDAVPDAAKVQDLCDEFDVDSKDLVFYKVAAKGKIKSTPVELDWS